MSTPSIFVVVHAALFMVHHDLHLSRVEAGPELNSHISPSPSTFGLAAVAIRQQHGFMFHLARTG
jgi:hypothetical protein